MNVPNALIEASQLTVQHGSDVVLDSVNFTISPG